MALDENFETTSADLGQMANPPAHIVASWRAFVVELAYDMALFTDRRDAEGLSEALLAIVTDAFALPAIAA